MHPALYVHVPFCVRKCHYCAFFSIPLPGSSVKKVPDATGIQAVSSVRVQREPLHQNLADVVPSPQESKLCSSASEFQVRGDAESRDTVGQATPEGQSLAEVYLEGLAAEAAAAAKNMDPSGQSRVSSLFIGGGTPTALGLEELERLLAIIEASFTLAPGAERTIEGNPGTLSPAKLTLLCHHGINRISLGAQSFDETMLRRLGRIHSVEDIFASVRFIRAAGIDNFNLDLMFGLPGQSLADWEKTLAAALSCEPAHISVYGLSIEEGTPFGRYFGSSAAAFGQEPGAGCQLNSSKVSDPSLLSTIEALPPLPDDDLQAEMYERAVNHLEAAGYRHYETSNFARPGCECRHNLTYWRGGDYLGLGPGAVSCLQGVRRRNVEAIGDYAGRALRKMPLFDHEDEEVLTLRQRMTERVMLGLRLAAGVDLEAFATDFGVSIDSVFGAVIKRYASLGILAQEEKFLRLNPHYAFVANAILQDFI